jgi:hypothetical protein
MGFVSLVKGEHLLLTLLKKAFQDQKFNFSSRQRFSVLDTAVTAALRDRFPLRSHMGYNRSERDGTQTGKPSLPEFLKTSNLISLRYP